MNSQFDGKVALVTGDSSEIATAVAFLASDESSYVTGSELFVDGGRGQV